MLIEALGKRHVPHLTALLLACSHGGDHLPSVKLLY
jgi:hypothetical protein